MSGLTGEPVEGVSGVEGVEGIEPTEAVSERPGWLPEKFESPESLAEAYTNLEKKLGAPRGTAPEEYDWGDYKDKFDFDDTPIEEIAHTARELKLSQDEFSKLVGSVAKYQSHFEIDTDAESAKLGEKPQARLDAINTWAANNLSKKGLEAFKALPFKADYVEMLDELRQIQVKTASRIPITEGDVQKFEAVSPESVKLKIANNYQRYQDDASYRAELNQELKLAYGEE